MPTFLFDTELNSLTGSDFGCSVAIDGNTLVIGSEDDTASGLAAGAAYVYILQGNEWVLQATLFAGDAAAGDLYGYQVAISGDTLAVSAPHHEVSSSANAGAVYVYTRSGTTWTLQQEITDPAALAQSGNNFGNALTLNGDTLFVGSNTANVALASTWIYLRSAGVWTLSQQILLDAGIGSSTPLSGRPFSMSSTIAALGGYLTENGNVGQVHVWALSAGTWSEQQVLTPSDGASGDQFGKTVFLSGSTLFIGAPNHGAGGAVYVFTLSGGVWTQVQEILPNSATDSGGFGMGIAAGGSSLFIGSPQNASDKGATSYYVFQSGSWVFNQSIAPSNLQANAFFGNSIAFNSVNPAIGAVRQGLLSSVGKVYVSDPVFGLVTITFKGEKVYS